MQIAIGDKSMKASGKYGDQSHPLSGYSRASRTRQILIGTITGHAAPTTAAGTIPTMNIDTIPNSHSSVSLSHLTLFSEEPDREHRDSMALDVTNRLLGGSVEGGTADVGPAMISRTVTAWYPLVQDDRDQRVLDRGPTATYPAVRCGIHGSPPRRLP
ncbi:hypothetical protein [Nocardia sp. NPDC051570]|uniref:hypothetical protein n=1 Tax=Nocardia sp. NPDC051570 TaxID=3364324 RepID=UPI0037AD88DF